MAHIAPFFSTAYKQQVYVGPLITAKNSAMDSKVYSKLNEATDDRQLIDTITIVVSRATNALKRHRLEALGIDVMRINTNIFMHIKWS